MEKPHTLQDGLNIVFTDSFFDVVCLLADLDETEIEQWEKGTMQYGLYKQQCIPFFVLDNGAGLLLTAAFNILQLSNKKLAHWLIHPERLVRLILMEKHTGEVKATRYITFDKTAAAGLRQYLQQQYIRYGSRQLIVEKAALTATTTSAEKMMEIATGFHAKWQCRQLVNKP